MAPLKKTQRVMEKVSEKYAGDFTKVCDLARMTFSCDGFQAARLLFEALVSAKELAVTLVKDRLMPEFDAKQTGGYRDTLVNVIDAHYDQ